MTSCSSTEAKSDNVVASFQGASNGVGRSSVNTDENAETQPQVAAEPNGITICVDPGHGFEDGGAESEYLGTLCEKDINLSVANYLKDELKMRGYSVLMTHDGNEFPITDAYDNNNKFNPYERVAYANSITSDYYVSLHCNSYESNINTSGTRIYYYDGESKITRDSEAIAESIRSNIAKAFPDAAEPISEFNDLLYVIRNTKAPASLIEMGFVTNQAEAQNMINPDWQKTYAKAVADGIDAYYEEVNK